jgi:hypothetical protein
MSYYYQSDNYIVYHNTGCVNIVLGDLGCDVEGQVKVKAMELLLAR